MDQTGEQKIEEPTPIIASTPPREKRARKVKLPDLIKPYDAVEMLEDLVGGSDAAKNTIIDKIEDGKIRAYAAKQWISGCKNVKAAWEDEAIAEVVKMSQIRREIFVGSSLLTEDMKKWKWRSGKFYVTHRKKKEKVLRHMFLGVHLSRDDVVAIAAKAEKSRKGPAPGGRNFKKTQWGLLFRSAINVIFIKNYTIDSLPVKKEFANIVHDSYKSKAGNSPLALATVESELNLVHDDLAALFQARER